MRVTDTFYEDQYAYLITSRSVFFKMRNVSDKVVEKIRHKFYVQ